MIIDYNEINDDTKLGPQVASSLYEFSRYVTRGRWLSFWHQVNEIMEYNPNTVLEIGKGPGILEAILKHYGVKYFSMDICLDLEPDCVASVTKLPFKDEAFDMVGCFQVLEHIPYTYFAQAVSEIARVSKNTFVISLPDARLSWQYSFHIPKLGQVRFSIPRPQLRPKKHLFDGQHYWEINKADYSLARIINDIENIGVTVEKTYRVMDNEYHRFFCCKKIHN